MNYIRHLNAFFNQIKKDDRLTSCHVALYLALFQYWNYNRFQNPFPVYRDNIMQLSRLGSKNTYHKCTKELHSAGYITQHPSKSKYQPARISMIRLDIKEKQKDFKQLELFQTDHVPQLTTARPINEPIHVPQMVHSVKQPNIISNNEYTPSKKLNRKENASKPQKPPRVPKLVLPPTVSEVEAFFEQNNHPKTEAQKFYYYNQGKNWMLSPSNPITDWKSIAHKWMLNISNSKGDEDPKSLADQVADLKIRYLKGEKIAHLIRAEHFHFLNLQFTEDLHTVACKRRMEQLMGSNQNTDIQLLHAYYSYNPSHPLLLKDTPAIQLISIRLAVINWFKNNY